MVALSKRLPSFYNDRGQYEHSPRAELLPLDYDDVIDTFATQKARRKCFWHVWEWYVACNYLLLSILFIAWLQQVKCCSIMCLLWMQFLVFLWMLSYVSSQGVAKMFSLGAAKTYIHPCPHTTPNIIYGVFTPVYRILKGNRSVERTILIGKPTSP